MRVNSFAMVNKLHAGKVEYRMDKLGKNVLPEPRKRRIAMECFELRAAALDHASTRAQHAEHNP